MAGQKDYFLSDRAFINTTYLFMAQEDQTFKIKEDENSDVRWIAVTDIDQKVRRQSPKPNGWAKGLFFER
jgi:isopentenyldiphosphate isomerase